MTATDYLCWATEFALEAIGAYFFVRRRIPPLWLWLSFRALADIVTFLVLKFSGDYAYAWADHVQRMGQYLILAVLSIYAVGQILRESKHVRQFYAVSAFAVGGLGLAWLHAQPVTMRLTLAFETWFGIILAAVICAAVGIVNGRAPKPWLMIACGLVIHGLSDGGLAFAQAHGWRVEPYYPIGAIAALAVMVFAARPERIASKRDLELVRLYTEEAPKKSPVSVRLSAEDEKWLRQMRIADRAG